MSTPDRIGAAYCRFGLVVVAMMAVLGATQLAWPQALPAPPAREDNPGLVNEIGKLLKNPTSLLPSFTSPSETTEPPKPDAAKPLPAAPEAAAPAVAPPAETRLPDNSSRPIVPAMVSGRAVCPVSAAGGPDCKAAADTLCRSKGYSDGKSLASDAVEKCSAKLLIPGRARQPGDCKTESFVTRAWCQ
jgi:hypothetical protein